MFNYKEVDIINNIKIVTDSNSDLSDELIKKYDISVAAQYVNFDDCSYRDGVDLTSKGLYENVSKYNKLPKTAAPSPADFRSIFSRSIDEGKDIICICTSSGISATFQNANIAASEFPEGRIELVDSLNISAGIGILVLRAVDYINGGLDIHETAKILRGEAARIKTTFIVDTLDYLRKGGRCTAVENFLGNILKIRPVISVVDGKLALVEKTRGSRSKALRELLGKVLQDREKIDLQRILIPHSMSYEDAPRLKSEIEKQINPEQVIVVDTGCSVSTHCGPNTIGIIYLTK